MKIVACVHGRTTPDGIRGAVLADTYTNFQVENGKRCRMQVHDHYHQKQRKNNININIRTFHSDSHEYIWSQVKTIRKQLTPWDPGTKVLNCAYSLRPNKQEHAVLFTPTNQEPHARRVLEVMTRLERQATHIQFAPSNATSPQDLHPLAHRLLILATPRFEHVSYDVHPQTVRILGLWRAQLMGFMKHTQWRERKACKNPYVMEHLHDDFSTHKAIPHLHRASELKDHKSLYAGMRLLGLSPDWLFSQWKKPPDSITERYLFYNTKCAPRKGAYDQLMEEGYIPDNLNLHQVRYP